MRPRQDIPLPTLIALAMAQARVLMRGELLLLRRGVGDTFGWLMRGLICLGVAGLLVLSVLGLLGDAATVALIGAGIDPVWAPLIVAAGYGAVALIFTYCGLRAFRAARGIPARHLDRLRDDAARLKETM